jgi:hypothetical protein
MPQYEIEITTRHILQARSQQQAEDMVIDLIETLPDDGPWRHHSVLEVPNNPRLVPATKKGERTYQLTVTTDPHMSDACLYVQLLKPNGAPLRYVTEKELTHLADRLADALEQDGHVAYVTE